MYYSCGPASTDFKLTDLTNRVENSDESKFYLQGNLDMHGAEPRILVQGPCSELELSRIEA
jgi:hypothetical protein